MMYLHLASFKNGIVASDKWKHVNIYEVVISNHLMTNKGYIYGQNHMG